MPPLRFFVHVIASVAESSGRALIGRRRRRAWPFLFEVVVGVLRRNFEDLIARIAEEGLVVIAPDYRLAPEHTIADACADACAVIEAAIAEGWPASSIVLGGDSAGGGLAYLVGIALRDSGRSLPAAIATIAPWVDLTCTGASFEDNERFDWGTGEALRAQAHLAAGRSRLDDPTISPAFADLRGLPPSLIHVGEAEIHPASSSMSSSVARPTQPCVVSNTFV